MTHTSVDTAKDTFNDLQHQRTKVDNSLEPLLGFKPTEFLETLLGEHPRVQVPIIETRRWKTLGIFPREEQYTPQWVSIEKSAEGDFELYAMSDFDSHDPHKGTAYKIIIDPDGAVKGMHNSAITMHLRYLRDADYMPENRDAAISAGAEILRQLKNKAGDPVPRSKIQR